MRGYTIDRMEVAGCPVGGTHGLQSGDSISNLIGGFNFPSFSKLLYFLKRSDPRVT